MTFTRATGAKRIEESTHDDSMIVEYTGGLRQERPCKRVMGRDAAGLHFFFCVMMVANVAWKDEVGRVGAPCLDDSGP